MATLSGKILQKATLYTLLNVLPHEHVPLNPLLLP